MQAKFTRQAKAALQIAESAARSWKHSYIGTEHILVGLLKDGGIPLSLGFACGDMVLTVAVLAIVLTAPLGAFVIDLSYKKLLDKR